MSIFSSLPFSINNTWIAGLNLSKDSKLFSFFNEFVYPFTDINMLSFFAIFFVLSSLLRMNRESFIKGGVPSYFFNWIYSVILAFYIDYGRLARLHLVSTYLYHQFRLLIFLVSVVGLTFFIYCLLDAFLNKALSCCHSIKKDASTYVNVKKAFLIIFGSWLPYLLVLYPGVVNYDTYNQLVEFFGHGDWVRDIYPIGWYLIGKHSFSITNQHNFLVTVLYGTNFKIGIKLLHNAGAGLFISTLEQTVFAIVVLVYSLITFNRLGMSTRLLVKFQWFYALFPMLPIISVFLTKNVINGIALLLAILLLVNALNNDSCFQRIKWWLLLIVSLFIQLASEKYSVYIIVFSAVIVLFLWHSSKHFVYTALVSLVVAFGFSIGQHTLFSYLKVPNGDPIESEAVMIESTALYQRRFPNQLTVNEKRALNKVFIRRNLSKLYVPGNSDGIKSSGAKVKGFVSGYRYKTVKKSDIKQYKKVWINMMLKHPEILLESFMNQGYSYIDILSKQANSVTSNVAFDAFNIATPNFKLLVNDRYVQVNYSNHFKTTRHFMALLFNVLSQVPPFMVILNGNLLIACSIVAFLLVLADGLYKRATLLFFILLQVPIFMMSPVNGNQRYMYPFFILIGTVIGLTNCWICKNNRPN